MFCLIHKDPFKVQIFSRILKRSPHTLSPQQQRGLWGEKTAACYLKKKGFKILVHRYRCKFGEIDLVARQDETLVFIEVKTRGSSSYGDPSQAVTPEKQKHISRVALDYLRRLNHPQIPVRFDVVEIVDSNGHIECHHIENAFPLSEPYLY